MNLATTISLSFGGQGSGCQGPNCGRPSIRWKVNSGDRAYLKKHKIVMKEIPIEQIRKGQSFLRSSKVQEYQKKMLSGQSVSPVYLERGDKRTLRGGGLHLEDGHHRLAAAERLGHKTVMAFILPNGGVTKWSIEEFEKGFK